MDAVELCITTVGLQEVDQDKIFSLYPNPTDGNLTIKYNLIKDANFTLYDLQGKALISKKLNESVQNLIIEKLAKGIYLMKVSGDSFSQCKKIIVK